MRSSTDISIATDEPTAGELAISTIAYAHAKNGISALLSGLPLLIAIGLKKKPETSEVEELRSAFRLLDWDEERRIAETTLEMLNHFGNDQDVAAAEKQFNEGSSN